MKAYFYPFSKIKPPTPYFDFFIHYFQDKIDIVNKDSKSSAGIINIFKYIFNIDLAFLNFPEDMIDKRYGFFQSLCFVFLILPIMNISGKKIIWTMHNKKSHYSENAIIKNFLYSLMLRVSDLIIIHAKDGEKFICQYNKDYQKKIYFFPHPVKNMRIPISSNKPKYDFIIWGVIAPYKGVDLFLEYLHKNSLQKKYNILIAGKISTPALEKRIEALLTKNITLINRFVTDEELIEFISSARAILFPYKHDSVLASGALVYSLNFKKPIIGPNLGAFKDLSNNGLVYTFNDYEDIEKIDTSSFERDRFENYVRKVSWEKYAEKLIDKINNLL